MSSVSMHLFRIIDGKRTKVKFTLDDKMTILDEQIVPDVEQDPHAKIKADLDSRGVKYEMQDGKLVITQIPEIERRAVEAMTNIERCWFDGCEDIVRAYKEELNTLPEGCLDCQTGAVIRKYRQLLINEAGRKATHPGA